MFLHKKSLIIHNQKRVKERLRILKNQLFQEIENIVNDEDLPLEFQESGNTGITERAIKKVLERNLKILEDEQI